MPEMRVKRARQIFLLGSAAMLVACGEEPVRVYHVASESTDATAPAMEAPKAPTPGDSVRWQKPESWTELPPDGTRLGNFTAAGGDGSEAAITVIRLDGTAGGTLANVNRWRGQLNLAPVEEAGLESEKIPAAGGKGEFEVFTLEGGEAGAMLAAQLPLAAETWFFKMTGSAAAVAAQRENFLALLASVEIAPADGHDHDHDHDHEAAPPVPNVAAPKLEVPEGWAVSEGSAMRLASFRISAEGERGAAVSVVSLKGDGGGLEANLNLWRTQLQLRDLTAEELRDNSVPLKSGLGDLVLVHFESTDDLLGEGRKAAILGAMGQAGERTWFFKLSGDLDVVEAEKEKFRRFVETATPQ